MTAPDAYQWKTSPQTLVIAVKEGCHFCEQSIPFYKRIAELQERHLLNANVIVITPDNEESTQKFLGTNRLNFPGFAKTDFSSFNIEGTPTVFLADSNGVVRNVWIGEQDNSEQVSIEKSIEK